MEDEQSEEPEEYEEYKESRHKKSSLYDTSVPYSHRKGYTWAGTTANELIAIWQRLPFINLTQPNQRTLSQEVRTGITAYCGMHACCATATGVAEMTFIIITI